MRTPWILNGGKRSLLTGLLGLLLAGAISLLPAQTALSGLTPLQPEPRHAETAQLIAKLLAYQHFNSQPINDALSSRVMDAYIRGLDPDRYYFLASDLREFENDRYRLDDMLLDGDLSAPYRLFNRLRERSAERTTFALQVLESGVDLDSNRLYRLDRKHEPWAIDRLALDRIWRDRIKHDMLTLLLAGESEDEARSLLESRYRGMSENIARSESEDVFETFMSAWGRAFDPHTAYLSPRNSREFDIQMQLSLEGIGAVLRSERNITEIVELITGGPAARDGRLQPGDRIIGVGQTADEIIDVVGWRLRDVVDMIRGPKESEVHLRVLPAESGSGSSPRVISLIRNEVALEEQAAQADVQEVERQGVVHRIGVVTIPTFYADFAAAQAGQEDYRSTTRDVSRLLAELASADIAGLIIDLRGNAGGSLQEAATLTGLFIQDGPVVQVVRSDGNREVLRDRDGRILYNGPLTIMVDRFSASASEIFAGAMQDYGRGLVVGEPTFGKGTVQSLVDLNRFMNRSIGEAGRLKLTIAKFYRISGSSTQKRGVEPDILLPSGARSDESGEAAADNALPWDEIRPVRYSRSGDLRGLLGILTQRHDDRLRNDQALQAFVAELRNRIDVADREHVSLNRAERERQYQSDRNLRLSAANTRRVALGLEPVDDLDALLRRDDEPDLLLRMATEIATDLYLVQHSPSTMQRWTAERREQ
jgi:carboxyl-terminal processing protease